MSWSQGRYLVVEASSIAIDNGDGDWFYVGHFLGLQNNEPQGSLLSRSSGPFKSEAQAKNLGKDAAGKAALKILTDGKWPD